MKRLILSILKSFRSILNNRFNFQISCLLLPTIYTELYKYLQNFFQIVIISKKKGSFQLIKIRIEFVYLMKQICYRDKLLIFTKEKENKTKNNFLNIRTETNYLKLRLKKQAINNRHEETRRND